MIGGYHASEWKNIGDASQRHAIIILWINTWVR